MLYILMGIGVILIICGLVIKDEDAKFTCIGSGTSVVILVLIPLLFVLANYNSTKSTADRQIAVLEERNELVIEQIEPLVDKYLNYESSTYRDLKLNANTIVSMANYPQLKGNEFVQSQIQIIVYNQREITKLKLDKAKLNGYKMWIFVGE